MFDWFKNSEHKNVVSLPFPKPVIVPYVEPPEPKKESKTYYTFGLTDDNRMAFTMGYTTLTMNREGIQELINQLEFFKNQLHEEQE
jgi:hypothetical protein